MASSEAASSPRWQPRPLVAALLRAVVLVAPLLASFVFVHYAAVTLRPPHSTLGHVVWWIALTVAATGVLVGVDRLLRRLLPLAALLKLALVFPHAAPSRFRTALDSGTTGDLEERLAAARAGRSTDTPAEAAERLLGFVAALSDHDRITRGHSERVRAYSQMIAKELHLGRDEIDRLNWAALLHDIGKLEIAPEILNKDGRPSDEEWQQIRRHPEIGARMAEPLRDWLGVWADAISDHHERWDGKGYPDGKAGEEISLAGRIVAVADVFDVITSARSYKEAGSAREGRDEIARCSGAQFDPRVVRAFLNVSLGRQRLAMGPLAWLAQAPLLAAIPAAAPSIAAVGSAGAVVGTLAAGLAGGAHIDSSPAARGQPASSPPAIVAVAPVGSAAAAAARARGGPAGGVISRFSAASRPGPHGAVAVAAPVKAATALHAQTASLAGPGFVAGGDMSVSEDAGAQTLSGWASDLTGGVKSFALSVSDAHLFASGGSPRVAPDGTLTYTPAANANGTSEITVQAVAADGTRSDDETATITVRPVNDQPAFTAGADDAVLEDSGARSVVGWARGISPGPADESEQTHWFAVTNDHATLFTAGGQPAVSPAGVLTYTAVPNESGVASVGVRIVDDGGTTRGGDSTSAVKTFRITVSPVDDAPSFVAGASQTALQTAGPQSVPGWATAISPGPPDEAGQAVSFAATPADSSLFAAGGLPVVSASGALTYTPAAGAQGTTTVSVRAVDDGGTAGGGVDTSGAQAFSITITPVAYRSSILYLNPTGPTSEVWDLGTTAPASSLLVPDYDGDLRSGLTLKAGDGSDSGDALRSQTWRYPLAAPLPLRGAISLHLASSSARSNSVSAYVYDCAAGGIACTQIATTTYAASDWTALGFWSQHDIPVGSVNRTMAAGRELRVRLYSGVGDQWVAMTASLPSYLTLTIQ